jgi:MFS family permease
MEVALTKPLERIKEMGILSEIFSILIDIVSWGLTLTGAGIALVGMLYVWGERSRRLALIVVGSLMLVLGQIILAAHHGGWKLALLSAIVFGIGAGIAILGEAFQAFLVEPVVKKRLTSSKDPLSRWTRKWLRDPRYRNVKRFLFPYMSMPPDDRDD